MSLQSESFEEMTAQRAFFRSNVTNAYFMENSQLMLQDDPFLEH